MLGRPFASDMIYINYTPDSQKKFNMEIEQFYKTAYIFVSTF